MGKKNKQSGKRALKTFVKGNKVLLAALGGAAAGITLANLLGTEKAQQMIKAVEDSVASIGEKVKYGINKNGISNEQRSNPALQEN